mgnify:CR=1 FL=1
MKGYEGNMKEKWRNMKGNMKKFEGIIGLYRQRPSKSQSLYIGGEIEIFPSPRAYIKVVRSPKASLEGESLEFFQVPELI